MKVGKTAYLHYFLTALVLGLARSINGGAQGWAGGAVLLLLDLFGGGVIIVCALGLLGNLLTAVQRTAESPSASLMCAAKSSVVISSGSSPM